MGGELLDACILLLDFIIQLLVSDEKLFVLCLLLLEAARTHESRALTVCRALLKNVMKSASSSSTVHMKGQNRHRIVHIDMDSTEIYMRQPEYITTYNEASRRASNRFQFAFSLLNRTAID